jgi:hypothetical protein
MDHGSLIHKLLLDSGPRVVVVNAKAWNTNAAKEERQNAWDAGMLPVLAEKHEEAQDVASTLRKRIADLGISFHGRSEVSFTWTEEGIEPKPVLCRSRVDHLIVKPRFGQIIEIKTGQANPKDFGKKSCTLGYEIQRVAHTSGVEHAIPDLLGRVRHVTLLCELEEPYCVTPIEATGEMLELGHARWNRALALWSRCLTVNNWPGYATGVYRVAPPHWFFREEMELEEAQNDEEEDVA